MSKVYPAEVREKAVRLVRDHRDDYPSEWAAIRTVAGRLSVNPETVRTWVRRAEAEEAEPVVDDELQAEVKALRRKNLELERSIEILKAATSFFVRECDPRQM